MLADMSSATTPVVAPCGSTAARPLPAERAERTVTASTRGERSARPNRTAVVRRAWPGEPAQLGERRRVAPADGRRPHGRLRAAAAAEPCARSEIAFTSSSSGVSCDQASARAASERSGAGPVSSSSATRSSAFRCSVSSPRSRAQKKSASARSSVVALPRRAAARRGRRRHAQRPPTPSPAAPKSAGEREREPEDEPGREPVAAARRPARAAPASAARCVGAGRRPCRG